jgi:hypothetical protein
LLRGEFRLSIKYTSYISSRLSERFDVTVLERIVVVSQHHHWNGRPHGSSCLQREFRAIRNQYIRSGCNQLVRGSKCLRCSFVGSTVLEGKVLAFGETQLAQRCEQNLMPDGLDGIAKVWTQPTDARHFRALLGQP